MSLARVAKLSTSQSLKRTVAWGSRACKRSTACTQAGVGLGIAIGVGVARALVRDGQAGGHDGLRRLRGRGGHENGYKTG